MPQNYKLHPSRLSLARPGPGQRMGLLVQVPERTVTRHEASVNSRASPAAAARQNWDPFSAAAAKVAPSCAKLPLLSPAGLSTWRWPQKLSPLHPRQPGSTAAARLLQDCCSLRPHAQNAAPQDDAGLVQRPVRCCSAPLLSQPAMPRVRCWLRMPVRLQLLQSPDWDSTSPASWHLAASHPLTCWLLPLLLQAPPPAWPGLLSVAPAAAAAVGLL